MHSISFFQVRFFFPFVCLLATGFSAYSQHFHFFRFSLSGDTVTYRALLTIMPNDSAAVRVIPEGKSEVYELTMSATQHSGGGTYPKRSWQTLQMEEILSFSQKKLPFEPIFVFSWTQTPGMFGFEPSEIQLIQNGNLLSANLISKNSFDYTEINPDSILQFYHPNDAFVQSLFPALGKPTVVSRGLSSAQKRGRFILLVVTDTADEKVGESCKRDLENIPNTFNRISREMGLSVPLITTVTGVNFSRRGVESALSKLKPKPDDMVIFYYSGHGYRNAKEKSPYPTMLLSHNYTEQDVDSKSMRLAEVEARLSKLPARFTFIMADCCNSVFPAPTNPSEASPPTVTGRSPGMRIAPNNFAKLFLQPRGILVAYSAEPTQFSVGNPLIGGFFTWYFRASLEKQLHPNKPNGEVSWENLLFDAGSHANYWAKSALCDDVSGAKVRCTQVPAFNTRKLIRR